MSQQPESTKVDDENSENEEIKIEVNFHEEEVELEEEKQQKNTLVSILYKKYSTFRDKYFTTSGIGVWLWLFLLIISWITETISDSIFGFFNFFKFSIFGSLLLVQLNLLIFCITKNSVKLSEIFCYFSVFGTFIRFIHCCSIFVFIKSLSWVGYFSKGICQDCNKYVNSKYFSSDKDSWISSKPYRRRVLTEIEVLKYDCKFL